MKILVECHSLLGDLILMMPLIKELKRQFPECTLDVVVGSRAEQQILSNGGEVNETFIFSPSILKKISLLLKLRTKKYDVGFVSINENAYLGALFLKAVGCKKQIGQTSPNRFVNYNTPIDNTEFIHRVEKNCHLITGLTDSYKIDNNTLFVSDSLKKWANDQVSNLIGKKTVGLCLGTGDFIYKKGLKRIKYNCKKWGYDKFVQLTEQLNKQNYNVIWLGGNKEKDEIQAYMQNSTFSNQLYATFIGTTSIMESIALLDVCDLVIGGDTGLMHCAAALNIPTLCIFGATDPKEVYPYSSYSHTVFLNLPCSPCYKSERAVVCKNRKCLTNITVDLVLQKALAIMD